MFTTILVGFAAGAVLALVGIGAAVLTWTALDAVFGDDE
jgi:hypothetical protein